MRISIVINIVYYETYVTVTPNSVYTTNSVKALILHDELIAVGAVQPFVRVPHHDELVVVVQSILHLFLRVAVQPLDAVRLHQLSVVDVSPRVQRTCDGRAMLTNDARITIMKYSEYYILCIIYYEIS